jgi:hypothetical protein
MYPIATSLMTPLFLTPITTVKLKEILFMSPHAFLYLLSTTTVSQTILLNLVSTNINDLRVSVSDNLMVTPDKYRPSFDFDFKLISDYQHTASIPRSNY